MHPSSRFHICAQISIHIHPMLKLGTDDVNMANPMYSVQLPYEVSGVLHPVLQMRSLSLKESKQAPSCWLEATLPISHNLIISLTYDTPGVIKTTVRFVHLLQASVCAELRTDNTAPLARTGSVPQPPERTVQTQVLWAENAFNPFFFTFQESCNSLRHLKIFHCDSFC